MEQIGREYARKIDWLETSVMPWETVGGHRKPNIKHEKVDWSKTPFR